MAPPLSIGEIYLCLFLDLSKSIGKIQIWCSLSVKFDNSQYCYNVAHVLLLMPNMLHRYNYLSDEMI